MDDDQHATSDVPDEWQGLPDYLLDDLEVCDRCGKVEACMCGEPNLTT